MQEQLYYKREYMNGSFEFAMATNDTIGIRLYKKAINENNIEYFTEVTENYQMINYKPPPVPNNIKETDPKKVKLLFCCNLIFGLIGLSIYWFSWPLSIIMMIITIVFLIKRYAHSKNLGVAVAAIFIGIFDVIILFAGWMTIINTQNLKNMDKKLTMYIIFAPISICFSILFLMFSSISLREIWMRYEEKLNGTFSNEVIDVSPSVEENSTLGYNFQEDSNKIN